jgi:hypothetical protein
MTLEKLALSICFLADGQSVAASQRLLVDWVLVLAIVDLSE